MEELVRLIEEGKPDSALDKLEQYLDNYHPQYGDFEKMKAQWKNYEKAVYLNVHSQETVASFQVEEITDFVKKWNVALRRSVSSENQSENGAFSVSERPSQEPATGAKALGLPKYILPIVLALFGAAFIFNAMKGNYFIVLYDGPQLLLGVGGLIAAAVSLIRVSGRAD